MTCLICRYYAPIEPPEHKQDREAGRCEANCGKEWSQHTAIRYIRNHKKNIEGWCQLNPEHKRFSSGHVCGQVSVHDYFYNPHWAVERIEERDSLQEWAQKAYSTVIHGSNNWTRRRNEELEEQTVELRRQLKESRRISASRLKRLQKNENKPAESESVEPFRPHLVAAE
jgi:hypothetical protein